MTTQRWGAISSVLVVGLISVACGGTDDPVDQGPKYKYPDLSSFCEAKAEAECTQSVLDGCQTTEEACVIARRGEFCARQAPVGASYRPTEAEVCLAAVKAAYLDDDYTSEEKAKEIEACALLWGGVGGEGATCRADHQCDLDQDLRCVIRTNQFEGNCYHPQERQPAESCNTPDSVCVEGTFCTDSEPHLCGYTYGEGEPCSPVLLCDEGMRCIGEEGAQTCVAKLARGTECTDDSECTSDMCSQVGPVKQCVDLVRLSPNEPICDSFR